MPAKYKKSVFFLMVGVGLTVLTVVSFMIFVNTAYAQSNQQTISDDIANNPLAQEILEKIEKSKRWIENIQKRNSENLEKQKEIEEKRAEVLKHLEDDLKKWEDLWESYTFDSKLERTLANHPANSTDTIYDHPLKFTASKINAGRAALSEVIENGGGPEEARNAFVKAAKISRAELISANALYNVLSGNAYYNQQVLFESDGQFHEISGEELRKYYQDYRTNPEYLKANPFDKISWEDLGKNNPSTECRDGYTLVYRSTADDYVCTTDYTAEMWVRHGMGKVVDKNYAEEKVMDVAKLEKDRIAKKVDSLNMHVLSLHEHYEKKISDTKLKYEQLFVDTKNEQIKEEKEILALFNTGNSSKEDVSREITEIREKYAQLEENISDEKSRILKLLKNQQDSDIDNFVQNYEHENRIDLIWNSDLDSFMVKNS